MAYFLQKAKNKPEQSGLCSGVVPLTGIEPVRSKDRGILSPLRLPVPPHQPNENYYSIGKMKKQLFFLENLTVKGLF